MQKYGSKNTSKIRDLEDRCCEIIGHLMSDDENSNREIVRTRLTEFFQAAQISPPDRFLSSLLRRYHEGEDDILELFMDACINARKLIPEGPLTMNEGFNFFPMQ